MNIIKLKNCRNCFEITSNNKYIVACGDSVTVYRQEDISVQCTIPSKIFAYAYCCRFLSDDVVIMKNNYAQYMIYDIVQERVLWKFKVRGYDSINNDYLISSDGKSILDLVTSSSLNGPDMELVIFPQEKRYVLQPLKEPMLCQEGWIREHTVYTAKDICDGVYMAFNLCLPKTDTTQSERRIVLQHKVRFAGSDYKQVMQWDNAKPISPDAQSIPNRIKYMDSEQIIFDDLQYWNLITHQYGRLPVVPSVSNAWRFKKKSSSEKGSSIMLAKESYQNGPVAFSLGHLFDTETIIDERYRISLLASPDYQLVEIVDCVDGTEDWQICDIEFLDTPNRFLIGTMSGIYLCERELK